MRVILRLLVAWLVLVEQTLLAQDPEETERSAHLAAATQQSVVVIEQWRHAAQDRRSVSTGFFVASPKPQQAWVLTFLSRCELGDSFQIALGRTMVEAELIACDVHVGLALLQLHQVPRPALEIARTALTQSQAGSDIFIVDTTSTHGTPAQKGLFAGRESLAALEPSLLRLNLKYANGGAGSPVFNAQQQLIGLLTRPVPNADDSCYALPAERLQRFLADVRSHGKPVNSGLGLVVQKTATAPRILGCRESSPAERAGVEPDDLVLSVGPTKINSMQELIDSTEYLPVETPVEIRVLRGQQIKTLKITPSLKTQALQ